MAINGDMPVRGSFAGLSSMPKALFDGSANVTEQHNAKDDQQPAETGQMVALAVAAVLVDGAAA